MKMVTLIKILLVLASAITPISSDDEEMFTIKKEDRKEDIPDVTTESLTQKSEETTISSVRSSVKYSRVQKPILYGRKFELAKDSTNRKNELYSPIITNPIRTLPSNNGDLKQNSQTDAETLKHDQNEIFTNIQDLFKETNKGSFNKSYFLEEASEEENHGGEATIKSTQINSSEEVNSSMSKSRQDGDRSLLVVLPFKAEGVNVEELFTKSPLVRVIENDELNTQTGTTRQPPITREREILPTTDSNFITRKRWRPSQRYRTTTELSTSETTIENGEDVTKTYTNYNDVELVTKKYENPILELQNTTNHKFETDFYPFYKRLKNKIKKEQEVTKQEQPEVNSTTVEFQLSTTEKPKPKLKRKGQRRKSTTEGPPKPEELSKVLEILPPDMKDLLLHLGLNKENKEQQASENNFRFERPPQPVIDPMSYAVFKPLPLERQDENRNFVPDDMKDFLASFGLLPMGNRMQKSMKVEVPENKTKPFEDISDVNLDFLPADLKSLLQDMGLVKPSDKKEPTRIHIFNPSHHFIAHSEEDFEKINAILSSIKATVNESQSVTPEMQSDIIDKIKELSNLRYKNGNVSEINNEIKKIVVNNKTNEDVKHKTTAKRAIKLIDGPDPLMFSEESLLKNEVKRQDDSANTSSSATSISSTSSASSSSASSVSSASSASSASVSSSSSAFSTLDSSASSSSSSASGDASASGSGDDTETITEESPNIEALKESFGGGETASDDADIESSLPPKRPNGLYLLLDWNSFLEVGTEDDNRRVNLRFQPKIGDSRNFLPVSVP